MFVKDNDNFLKCTAKARRIWGLVAVPGALLLPYSWGMTEPAGINIFLIPLFFFFCFFFLHFLISLYHPSTLCKLSNETLPRQTRE